MNKKVDNEKAKAKLKEYEAPSTEVIRYSAEDIILTSPECDEHSGT